MIHQRVIWDGAHKNATRAVVTRLPGSFYEVEMWQRPEFGVRYVKTMDRKLRYAWDAASDAMNSYARRK